MSEGRLVQGASILIVDDTPANLRLLSHMLIQRGYKARAVTSGARALAAIAAHPPDLILLDIMMPGMNGYEVCERLKADVQTCDIPIIFLSALDATRDKVKAFNEGGVDYVTKPFQPQEVLARVETHLALRHLQKDLQQKVAELDAFAATVSHDLKDPLGLIVGFAETLLERYTTMPAEELGRYLQTIARSGRKMQAITDALLLLSRVRKTKIETTPLDMAHIVTKALEQLSFMIDECQAEVVLPSKKDWPVASGYGPWVEQVWVNYISNALKYGGEPPHVTLGATVLPDLSPGSSMVRFWVRDNGKGLAPEEQARVFTPFTRLHHIQAQGHGLGLSIVQRIVEKLGGQVGVESPPLTSQHSEDETDLTNQGSLFWFTLPLVGA